MGNKCCAPSYIPNNEDSYALLMEKLDIIIKLLTSQTDYMTNGDY